MSDEDKTKTQLIEELARLRQRNRELEAQETERHRELALLNREDQLFNSAPRLGQVLTIIMEGVRRLLDAQICSLWLVDPETDDLVCRQATGYRYELVQGWRLSPDQGIANWVVRHDQSLIVPDTRLDSRHFKEIDRLIGQELRSILSVPLRIKTKAIGSLQVTNTEVDQFNLTQLNLLEALAATAAVAIDNTRLYAQAQQTISGQQTEVGSAKLAEQFHHSQKMEAIGRLAGGVAHNFNNMLTVIMGHAGLALHSLPADHVVRADIEGIQKTAHQAAELTSQLLTFARDQFTNPQVLNLNDFIFKAEPILQRLIGPGIELVWKTEPNLGTVKIDQDQLEQLLVNLVANARDAMPNGGQLTLETDNVDLDQTNANAYGQVEPGSYVMLAVKDNGQGMTPEIQTHLFEPFFTTKEFGQGKGLALAICYGLVKQSDGHIAVESEPGQGTTFKIYLPRVEIEPLKSEARRQGNESLPEAKTILLVEDDGGVRSLTARILRLDGYQVLEASNGSEALRLLEQASEKSVDLLVTDVIMPQMSGTALISRLKAKHSELKVLFISGFTDNMLRDKGLLSQDTPFLPKPFKPIDLVRKVREMLSGKEERP